LPVFRGKGIQGQNLHSDSAASPDNFTNGLRPFFMPFHPVEKSLFGPTAVSVHYDRYMRRDIGKTGIFT
jgi:hypothetical protein